MRRIPIVLPVWIVLSSSPVGAQKTDAASRPRFENYPVSEIFSGTPAAPILSTTEQRRYRTRIRDGILPGAEAPYASWKSPTKHKGPNFAGHYFVEIWGCGSQCVMMATVDAKTGHVYEPPLAVSGSLYIPLDNLSDMEIDFRPDSSLIVLRDACRDFKNRNSCGTYYFNWKDSRFALLKFVAVNPIKDLVH